MIFKKHVFVCLHKRDDDLAGCCAGKNADSLFQFLKSQVQKNEFLKDVRVNRAGCLGQCAQGPVLVIYPQGHWYRFENESDLDDIIEESLVKDSVVSRLQLNSQKSGV